LHNFFVVEVFEFLFEFKKLESHFFIEVDSYGLGNGFARLNVLTAPQLF